jgi:hypothetical protein
MGTSLRTVGQEAFRSVDCFSGRVYVHRPGNKISCDAAKRLLDDNYLVPLMLEGKGGAFDRLGISAVLKEDLKGFTIPVVGKEPGPGIKIITADGNLIPVDSASHKAASDLEKRVGVIGSGASEMLLLTVFEDRNANHFQRRYELICDTSNNLEAVNAVVGIRDDESNILSEIMPLIRR